MITPSTDRRPAPRPHRRKRAGVSATLGMRPERPSRTISGHRSRHAVSMRAINTDTIMLPVTNIGAISIAPISTGAIVRGAISKPHQHRSSSARNGKRRNLIRGISRAIDRCIARATGSNRSRARHRSGISGRIAIAAAGRNKRRPDKKGHELTNGAERSAPFRFWLCLRAIDPRRHNGGAEITAMTPTKL